MFRRILTALLLLAPLLAGGAWWLGLWHPPPRWDPVAPLDLRAETNLLTNWKLARMALQPDSCFAAFAASGIPISRFPDRDAGAGCPLRNTMRLEAEVTLLPNRPMVTCPVAAAWALFERHALQPAALAHFGTEVASVRHLGTFNCRNVYGRAEERRSQHATANAIDIAAFALHDGREIRLARDWDGNGAEAAFLRDLRDGACRYFRAVLGPDYNAAHRDHFHLDRGGWGRCG